MKTYRQYVMETCGGWGWEAGARVAVQNARTSAWRGSSTQRDFLRESRIQEVEWVEALVFFLMGMKEGA